MSGPVTVMVPSPEGCVLVRLRHQSDEGLGHALGWFRLEHSATQRPFDQLIRALREYSLFFPDADGDEDGEITPQLIAQDGAVWVELVIGSADDDE